jgi:hypothetical protein
VAFSRDVTVNGLFAGSLLVVPVVYVYISAHTQTRRGVAAEQVE